MHAAEKRPSLMEETAGTSTPEEPTVMRVDEIGISTRGGEKRQRDKEDGVNKDKHDSGEFGTTALPRDEDDQRPEATTGGGGGTAGEVRRSRNTRKHFNRRAAKVVDVQIADDGARVETRLEDGARESTLTPLLAKEQGAVAGNEELSVSADVGDEGEEVMDHAAVMMDASAHVGGDETTAIVTAAGRMVVDGEGAGGESAMALLTDAGDSTTCGGDGVEDEKHAGATGGGGCTGDGETGGGGATESGPPVGTAKLSKNARFNQARRERERAGRVSRK